MPGLIIAAPSSGSGKTTLTLGLLRALARRGHAVRGAKSGPDYIDPRFHEAACGRPCPNLDAFAMTPARLRALAAGPGTLIVEGAMGLFDGAPPGGRGAVADLARHLALPVILTVDAGRMAQSVAPLVSGFVHHDAGVRIAGVILNNVGSDRHARMLDRALAPLGIPLLGHLPRDATLSRPSRHLGLVQAGEDPDLNAFLDRVADRVDAHIDTGRLLSLAAPLPEARPTPLRPPAQRIAVARDAAFSFTYPHLLDGWRTAGATIIPFSPLADDRVPPADLIYLPGGYPELHGGRLANAAIFRASLHHAAETTYIFGECGGYMVLGRGLVDANGTRHAMAGLLPLETSFAARRLHLGYRRLHAATGPMAGHWTGHEFHYATTLAEDGPPLFDATDAEGTPLPPMGLSLGRVQGSFAHLIEPHDRPFPPVEPDATPAP